MPRQVRIEFPGAHYHVMARGDRREDIYLDDGDREMFLATLAAACEKTGWRLHAYVLMSNHYHLLIETPEANLVKGMGWLQGTYTARFNSRHRLRGHVFGGRYKAVLVEAGGGEYFATLVDYIHLNPVRAGLVGPGGHIDSYPWSSLAFYKKPPSRRRPWEVAGDGLSCAGCRDTARGRRAYLERLEGRAAVERAEEAGLAEIAGQRLHSTLRRGWYFGSQAFREKVLSIGGRPLAARAASDLYHGQDVRDHSMEMAEKIVVGGLEHFDLADADLAALPKSDWRKAAVALVVRERTVASLGWLSGRLHMGARSGVSRYSKEVRNRAANDRKLRAQLRALRNIAASAIIKS